MRSVARVKVPVPGVIEVVTSHPKLRVPFTHLVLKNIKLDGIEKGPSFILKESRIRLGIGTVLIR
jgi:hypothetical protein